jgi:hypothetical protein
MIERLAVSMLTLSLDCDAVSSTILACAVWRSDSSFSTRAIRLETTTAAVSAAAMLAAIAIIVPGAFPGAPMKFDISLALFGRQFGGRSEDEARSLVARAEEMVLVAALKNALP